MKLFESTLRYGATGDERPVMDCHSTYDSLLIRSHLLAGTGNRMTERLQKLVSRHDIEFYIEPMAWDFRVGTNFRTEDGNLKDWHGAYAAALGEPFTTILQSEGQVDATHVAAGDIERISEAVVRFQEEGLTDTRNEDIGNYLDIETTDFRPTAVIPWMHKLTDTADVPLFATIVAAASRATDLPLKPCLFATKEFIREESRRTAVIDTLEERAITDVFLWIDDLDKRSTTHQEYTTVIDMVHELYRASIQPHMLYGDYFSHLLAFFGLGGTTYGTNSGEEKKEPEKPRGGGGSLRYYANGSRDFLQPRTAVEIHQTANTSVCTCDGCRGVLSTWDDLTTRQQSDVSLQPLLQDHFLCMKAHHTQQIATKSLDELLAALDSNIDSYAEPYTNSVHLSPSKRLDHLSVWKDVIEQEKDKAVQDVSALSDRRNAESR